VPGAAAAPGVPAGTAQPHAGILNPQGAAPVKRLYEGAAHLETDLLAAGWTQATINTLPIAP
jgi:hypothetical protein